MSVAIMWFRRDLRLADNPAVAEAVRGADHIVPLFVVDEALWPGSGSPRRAFLAGCLDALNHSTGGQLVVRRGRPHEVLPGVLREADADTVYCTGDFAPYGRRRDDRISRSLSERSLTLVRVDSPYLIPPGALTKDDGAPFKIFSAFYRAWRVAGDRLPSASPRRPRWMSLASHGLPEVGAGGDGMPEPGERAATAVLERFLDGPVQGYARLRNLPDGQTTSRLSPYLRFGCIHPRQLLARLGESDGEEEFRRQLAWRDFYAHVLFHWPESTWESYQPVMKAMAWDEGPAAEVRFAAWSAGRTGYPIVDAGMRQLLAEGWMHNRLRMIVASFLTKHLHLSWTRGARWFMEHLIDADLASNSLGWQWVAGTGPDAAPFFRIFNPVTQAKRFDPEGSYVRRWVPELASLPARFIHEPWKVPAGPGAPSGYPAPIVDLAVEREEALARYQRVRRAHLSPVAVSRRAPSP